MRRGRGGFVASPTMVGALTVLVVDPRRLPRLQRQQRACPFVPTYRISAQVPNADTLVPGNEVRVGGVRVGVVESIVPVQDRQRGPQRPSST